MHKKVIWIFLIILLIAIYLMGKKDYYVTEIFSNSIESIEYIWISTNEEVYICRDKNIIMEFNDLINQEKVHFTYFYRNKDMGKINDFSFGIKSLKYTDYGLFADGYIRVKHGGLPEVLFKYENVEFNVDLLVQNIIQFREDNKESFMNNN